MRKMLIPALATLAISAAAVSIVGMAASQTPPSGPTAKDAPPDELSAEDQNASPLPPGRYAALVKKVCVDCHTAKPILDLRYTKADAERFYKNMVSSETGTEQAQQVIAYLSTTLAP